MTPAQWCIGRPVATSMIFVSCLVLGAISSRLLPLELFPDVDFPALFIQMPYPGSAPKEVEQSIIRPAEEALSTLKGVKFINARATPQDGQIFLLFDWNADLGVKAVEARELLDAVRDELPSDLRRINVFKFSTGDQPILTLRISSDADLSESYDMLTRNLVRPVERIPGVAKVELQGVEPREIRIELDADRVEANNIELNALNTLLTNSNFSASAGTISANQTRYRVNPVGEYRSVDEIRNLMVNDRGLRLKDIANVHFEPRERNYARHLDQAYAIGLQIFKERGANLVEVAGSVLDAINEAGQSREMQGVNLFFLEDQAEGVKSSLRELLNAGLLGALMSMIVLYFFLRNWSITLMVSLAVPISITVTLGFMYMLGLSLNILSMMGLMLAVGMLVDNAVVVSEAIFTEREATPNDPVGSAARGIRSVGMAVLAGTLTSMAVFLPNLFGEMDQVKIFLQHVAAAICISLAMSLIIAQTLIPLVTTRVRTVPTQEKKTRSIDRIKERYADFLDWVLGHRGKAWLGIFVILGSVAIPISIVKQEMFPETFDRDLFLRYNLDAQYPLEEIEKAVNRIETFLYANKERFEIDKVYTYYDEQGTAQSSILLIDQEQSEKSSKAIREEIYEELPKIAIGQPSFDETRAAGAEGVRLSVTGESSEVLEGITADVMRALDQIDGLRDVRSEISAGNREVAINVDRDKARNYGIGSLEIAQAVAVALRGTQLTEYRGSEGEIPITLRFQESDSQSVEQLKGLKIVAPDGRQIPLISLVKVSIRTGPTDIQRTDRQTGIGITATLQKDFTMEDVRKEIEQVLDAFAFPPGYGWKFGRGFEFQDETAANMSRNILLAVLFIYLIMAALFESLVHPLSIVTGIVFSIVGVFWFFLITNTTFSLMAFIGILILIGVVVNNGIVLVDHINQLRWRGLPRRAAIIQGGKDRIRPILMTVGTTVLGLLPLCIGTTQLGGEGPPYFPMARAIVGGLVFSTVISLCVLPVIYSTVDDWSLWVSRRWRGARRRVLAGKSVGA